MGAGNKVEVEVERLVRLRRALEFASSGAFAEAVGAITIEEQDELGRVERGLYEFVAEFHIAVAQSEEAISELTAAKAELQQRLTTIERQQAAIRELSSPIIDMWDGVITVPLIGALDSDRIAELSARLLQHISKAEIAWVLLDLTGIELVDSYIADHLVKTAKSVRLMGAACVLTGIQPRVARTFEMLGISLEELRPTATLKEGLRYCIAQQKRR